MVEAGRAPEPEIVEFVRLTNSLGLHTKRDDKETLAEVRRILRRALRKHPNSPQLIVELAKAKNPWGDRNGDPDLLKKAIRLYEAQGKFPMADGVAQDLAEDIFCDGCDALDTGDLDSAEGFFREAIRIYSLHADAHNHLGIVCEEKGDWTAAARCYWQAVQLGRISCHEREVLNRRLAGLADAKTRYWGELSTRPFLRGLYNIANLYYRRKEFGLALGFARESLDINPNDNTGARFITYSILRLEGRQDEMKRLRENYRDESLPSEADALEIDCFGSVISRTPRRRRPN